MARRSRALGGLAFLIVLAHVAGIYALKSHLGLSLVVLAGVVVLFLVLHLAGRRSQRGR